jgi:hypothetical protein
MIYYGKDYPNGLEYSPGMPDADLLRWVHKLLTEHGERPYYQFMGDIIDLAGRIDRADYNKLRSGTP